ALVQDSEPPQQTFALLGLGLREVDVSVCDLARRRFLEPDQMTQQRALAASAAAHDDEDVAALHHEIEIAHQHETAVGHRQVAHDDVRFRAGVIFAVGPYWHRELHAYIPRKLDR